MRIARLSAWTMALAAAGLFVFTEIWWWREFSPWGRHAANWSMWVVFTIIPRALFWSLYLGVWLLGTARVLGGSRWGWRWWIGGPLTALLLYWIYDEQRDDYGIDYFPGFTPASIAYGLLAIWPVFYWAMRRAEKVVAARTAPAHK